LFSSPIGRAAGVETADSVLDTATAEATSVGTKTEHEKEATMVIRRLEAGDEAATRALFERIPEADQRFFKEDVGDPETVRHWVAAEGLGSQLVWKALALTRELARCPHGLQGATT